VINEKINIPHTYNASWFAYVLPSNTITDMVAMQSSHQA
jgi:hypothetical protein